MLMPLSAGWQSAAEERCRGKILVCCNCPVGFEPFAGRKLYRLWRLSLEASDDIIASTFGAVCSRDSTTPSPSESEKASTLLARSLVVLNQSDCSASDACRSCKICSNVQRWIGRYSRLTWKILKWKEGMSKGGKYLRLMFRCSWDHCRRCSPASSIISVFKPLIYRSHVQFCVFGFLPGGCGSCKGLHCAGKA